MSTDTSLGASSAQVARPRRRFRKVVALVGTGILALGLLVYVWPESPVEIERDRQSRFQIDPNQPYEISFWRMGLLSGDVRSIDVSHDGRVVLKESGHVHGPGTRWENKTKSFLIPEEARTKVLRAVETCGVMKMHRSYKLKNVFDGVQAKIVIQQGDREKSVFGSNYFPDGFDRFGRDLYAITEPYQVQVDWQATKRDGQ